MPYRRKQPSFTGPADADEDFAPASLTMVWEEDFDPFEYDPNGFLPTWITYYPDTARFHGLEEQIFTDPAYKGVTDSELGLDPFGIVGSPPILQIYMRALTPLQQSQVEVNYNDGQPPTYYSGTITSPTFLKETRGYWAVRVRCTAGAYVWPAFWLTNEIPYTPYEEIDIFEAVGTFPDQVGANVWLGPNIDTLIGHLTQPRIDYQEWSVYSVWVTDTGINCYINGALVNRVTYTVQDPLHMRLNLACRPNQVIPSENLPAIMETAWIRYYTVRPAPTAVNDTANIAATTAQIDVDVLLNDIEVDFGAVVTIQGSVSGAAAQVLADNRTIRVTRTSTAAGSYSLTYRVTTPFGLDDGTLSGTLTAYTQVPLGDYDPAHAINTSLVFMLGAHPAGSSVLGTELVSNAAITAGGGNFARDWTVPGLGTTWKVLDHPGGTTAGTLPASVAPPSGITGITGNFTIHIRLLVDAWVADWIDLLSFQGAAEYEIVVERNGAMDQVFCSLRANGSAVDGGGYNLTPGVETSLGFVRASGAASGCTTYIDGLPNDSVTIAADVDWDEVTSVLLGGTVDWCSNGAIIQLRVWDRALSDSEMRQLHDNPTIGLSTVTVP